jgi:REP element-mobilizing transposase RayT
MNHYAGHYYHVFNQGVDKRNIFINAENYNFLLRKFKANLLKYSVTMIAYCLMPNHYHLLLRPELDGVLSQFIQTVFNGYVQAFNVQEKRSGTLFEGRAKIKFIHQNEYFLHISRYIHLNPVRAGLVAKPEDWPYSNYLEFIGLRKGTLFSPDFVTENFDSPQNYQAFVEEQIPQKAARYLQSLGLVE